MGRTAYRFPLKPSSFTTMNFDLIQWQVAVFAIVGVCALAVLMCCVMFDREQRACMYGAFCITVSCVAGILSFVFFLPYFTVALAIAIGVFALCSSIPAEKSNTPSRFT